MGSVDRGSELAFARDQQRALELVASGAPLGEILGCIVSAIERQAPGMRGSVLLLPDGVHIRHGAAPRLSDHYMSLVDGAPIGPVAGSCGTAMWRNGRVIVADIASDPLWQPYREIRESALSEGLRACWSTPLHSGSGRVVGSFAMYFAEAREPTDGELRLADVAAHLCGLAIEHAWAAERLQRRVAEQAAVAAIGQRALLSSDEEGVMQELVAVVATALGHGRAALLERVDGGELRVRAAAGALGHEPLAIGAAITVEVPGPETPWGVLEVIPAWGELFGEDELAFLRSIVTVVAAAIERSRREQETRHQALHDPLTGLPNRALVMSLLGHALERAHREGGTVAVLMIDLDNFKLINDSLGHLVGDELLVALAPRLRAVVREADTVGRFGGDEFVVIAEALSDELEALTLAERLTEELARPCLVSGSAHHVSASIGVAVANAGRAEPDALLRDADAAMYHAKRQGVGHQMFDSSMRERAVARLRLVAALRDALERGDLSIAYQPIVSLADGATTGVEALLRWDAPGWRERPISEVVSTAEDSGLIRTIGTWVLESSLARMTDGDIAGAGSWLAVNLSAHQVAFAGLAPLVARMLDEHNVQPERLILEVTETSLFDEIGASPNTINELHQMGAQLALDDFGTGFSSLSRLMQFPIDVLKIDRSFIARLPGDPCARAIVSAITAMAHQLHKLVIAEGVETQAQLTAVRELACDCAQGYLLGRPSQPGLKTPRSRAPVAFQNPPPAPADRTRK